MHRFHPANLHGAWWAIRTARRSRRLLESGGLDAALAPPPPPPLPAEAVQGVRGALRRSRESCLVRSIVLQAWEAAHGRRRDLVIGTTGRNGFRAHAWLDGDPVPTAEDPEFDASVVNANGGEDWPGALEPNGTGEPAGNGEGALARYTELLRRPAPDYRRAPLTGAD